MSRGRTVYFAQDSPRTCLVPPTGEPIREIQFEKPVDLNVPLRPVLSSTKWYGRWVTPLGGRVGVQYTKPTLTEAEWVGRLVRRRAV